MTPTLVAIIGPTAIGKTALGIQLAEYFKTEIISADSRQMYRELKIGTALPTDDQLRRVKHHFIGNLSVCDYYNASMFEVEVLELLKKQFHNNPLLLLIGGSTLYINAVFHGIDDLPTVDPQLRNDLQFQYKTHGIEYLRLKLKLLDPEYYQRVDLKNPNRLLKAIEISLMTGKPYSSFLTAPTKKRDFNIIKIGLNSERKALFERINTRVDEMLEQGLLDEVKLLQPYRHFNSLNTVGYKELFAYLDNKIPYIEAIDLIKQNTRKYAKRQITWFNRDAEITWFEPSQKTEILDFINMNTK
jgi:tRNA dimethylallyltransferase